MKIDKSLEMLSSCAIKIEKSLKMCQRDLKILKGHALYISKGLEVTKAWFISAIIKSAKKELL